MAGDARCAGFWQEASVAVDERGFMCRGCQRGIRRPSGDDRGEKHLDYSGWNRHHCTPTAFCRLYRRGIGVIPDKLESGRMDNVPDRTRAPMHRCRLEKLPATVPFHRMETTCTAAPEVCYQTADLEVSRFIIRRLKQNRYDIGHHCFQIL